MKKQLLFILMMVLPMVALADDSGVCGYGVSFVFNESTGTLTISKTDEGNGGMYNAYYTPQLYTKYKRKIKTVIIENGVTAIGGYSFENFNCLTSVVIPSSVTRIDYRAFAGCSSLASISIPNSVTSIDAEVFSGCVSLSSITIPNNITLINNSVFEGCVSITTLEIPDGVTDILPKAFRGCVNLSSIKIPSSVKTIGSSAFEGCVNLSSLTIPDGVSDIGYDVFRNCGITSIVIPKSVTSIEERALHGCNSLTSIIVEEGNTKFDSRDNCNAVIIKASNRLIAGCSTTKIPQSVESIGLNAFVDCSNLSSIVIPKSVTYIGPGSFSGCNSLNSIKVEDGNEIYDSRDNCNAIIATDYNEIIVGCSSTEIPSTVKGLGNAAFSNLSSLKSITIPSNIETIQRYAFSGSSLENVIIKNIETSLYIKTNGSSFSDATFQHAILYVPAGQRWDAVYGNGGWYRFNNIREIAMESRELSEARAYTLMNTNDFSLAVYDAVNGEVANASSLYDIDENNASNAWQIIKGDDDNYLYNIGARQYAKINDEGKLVLSSSPVAISLHETKKGFTLGDNNGQQWGFVINENVKPYKDLSAIDNITSTAIRDAYYTLDGQRLSQVKKGLNIVRTSDGQAKKVIIK